MTASHDIGNQAPTGPRAGPYAGDGATAPVGDGPTPPVGDGATPPVGDGAVPFFLARRKVLTPLPVIVTVLATAAIGYVLYKTLIPVPPGPYNTFPYIFLAWIVIGLAWYLVLKVRNPARAARLGTLQERETADLESRIAAELIPETESSPS